MFGPAEVFGDANWLRGGDPAYKIDIISACTDRVELLRNAGSREGCVELDSDTFVLGVLLEFDAIGVHIDFAHCPTTSLI